MSKNLFDSLTLGNTTMSNRVVMAPLTRLRASEGGVPNDLMATHYAQRASVGLIVTEGTWPVVEGRTWYGQPGIETDEQQEAWTKIAAAVHAEGGTIAMQIMHGGRISHPELTGTGRTVGASPLAPPNPIRISTGKANSPVPHELTEEEIQQVIQDFVKAARRAIDAGMDAVQIHGANGYLLHQFLSPASNKRTDGYGGTPANHARLLAEVIRAVATEIGPERTGFRLSPQHNIQGAEEFDDAFTQDVYLALAESISDLKLHHVDILNADPASDLVQAIREAIDAPFVANTGFGTITTRDDAQALVSNGLADAVSVGRPVIANPDLVRRWREDLPENEPDQDTFYTEGARGYTDYPFYQG
jgi:2,4-dienoyl-CoA reductase-like NADH-dependent reductase (Old Yellow Enzyme family)